MIVFVLVWFLVWLGLVWFGLVFGFWLLGLVFKNKAFPLQKCPSHGGDGGTQKWTVAFA